MTDKTPHNPVPYEPPPAPPPQVDEDLIGHMERSRPEDKRRR
jgi:hypothetical protein